MQNSEHWTEVCQRILLLMNDCDKQAMSIIKKKGKKQFLPAPLLAGKMIDSCKWLQTTTDRIVDFNIVLGAVICLSPIWCYCWHGYSFEEHCLWHKNWSAPLCRWGLVYSCTAVCVSLSSVGGWDQRPETQACSYSNKLCLSGNEGWIRFRIKIFNEKKLFIKW